MTTLYILKMTINICRAINSLQKTINCYIILSIWILIIMAGIYKFLEPIQPSHEVMLMSDPSAKLQPDIKTKKIFQLCNELGNIISGEEGILKKKGWYLKGMFILIRHGDRGPLQHIRNISSVDCGTTELDLLNAYKNYLHNLTMSGKVSTWIGPGSFHGFPLLPSHPNQCHLGQLTMHGVAQLLKMGNVLRQSYTDVWSKMKNLAQPDVSVYSTRYHRTFQSALAFLFGMISSETLGKLTFSESPSMTFCFKDCGCSVTDKYARAVAKTVRENLKAHPAIKMLAKVTGNVIFAADAEQGHFTQDPQSVRDALLTYICHDSSLPCENPTNCIQRKSVLGIFMYHDWMMNVLWKDQNYRHLNLLRTYGLVKHIVNQMLHMLSNNGPQLVLYSGHDHTLLQLASVFSLHYDNLLCKYAGRLVFEVYSNSEENLTASGAYFRLLSNGRDVTRQVSFCKTILTVQHRVNVCKIEDIVRFLHEDYFTSFNVTNFKDACFMKTI